MSKLKVAYILLLTLAGIFFLYRESINVYWAQTYHEESPLVSIEQWGESVLEEYGLVKNGSKEDLVDDLEYRTEIISQEGIKEADRLFARSYQNTADQKEDHHANNQGVEGKEVFDENDPIANREIGADVKQDVAPEVFIYGPEIPQLPSDVIVTAGDKLFFVGDSLMQGVAPRVRQSLHKSENIDGVDLSKQSTGLAYPKFYNWPQVVADTLSKDKDIKAVVVYMGANDPWDFPVPGRKQYLRFKSADWERAYRERVQKILLSAHQYDLPVIWLGAPCMRKDKLHQSMVYLNTIYQSEMEKFNGHYIPTNDILGCSDEEYSAYVETEEGNRKVRTNDGIHFTVAGQRLIAERIIEELTIEREEVEEIEAEVIEAEEARESSEKLEAPKLELLSETETFNEESTH
ncbi:SGNH/GDSL hydrolase family protein [Ignatzschineria sp. LJL83]